MKKTIIAALIALLVMLAFAACDNIITEPGAEKSGTNKPEYTYTKDGRKLVTLSIKTSGTAGTSRVLSDVLARAEADWYEVIFKDDDSIYYKGDGRWGLPLKVSVAVQEYDSTNAIMLIGKKSVSGQTLLATGYIASTVNVNDQTEITFTVEALTADLSNSSTSTFEITNSSALGDFENFIDKGRYYIGDLGCFLVPSKNAGVAYRIDAKLTIEGFTNTGNLIVEEDNTQSATYVNFDLKKGSSSDNLELADGTGNVIVDFSSGDCEITFNFDTDGEAYYLITFKIPVIGLADTSGGLTWNIRGGTNIGFPDIDIGGSDEFQGEGVALEVADSPKGNKKTITAGGTGL